MVVGRGSFILVIVALLAVPSAAAVDPLHEQLCVQEGMCAGAGTCTPAACLPRGCVVASCSSELGPDGAECGFNEAIDGRTCAVHVGGEVGRGSPTRAGAYVHVTNGSVDAQELHNAWLTPGAEGHASVAGADLGYVYAVVYRSDIQTEGPRGGPFARFQPSPHHTWTEVGVAAGHHGGPGFGEDVVVALILLDHAPESCFVRSPSGALPGVECPSFGRYYRIALP
ncbi:MAG TPA: hypothetical protein VFH78_10985 [Candidatus Thermoplasmatota archaeon]|nr:hypothetical protein [Candidatus Thermoplasmatota archaeon]